MDNGCACCTVRGDLVRSLQGLKKKLEKFDMVMFETTGLADPAPIMKTFQQPEIMTHFRVDGVVCLVDSMFLKDHINEVRPEGTVNEAVQQVALANPNPTPDPDPNPTLTLTLTLTRTLP